MLLFSLALLELALSAEGKAKKPLGRLKASARDHVMQEADGAVVLQNGALGPSRAARREDDVAHICGACAAAHRHGWELGKLITLFVKLNNPRRAQVCDLFCSSIPAT